MELIIEGEHDFHDIYLYKLVAVCGITKEGTRRTTMSMPGIRLENGIQTALFT